MESLNIKLNLMKLSRTGVATIKGLRCLVIPLEENDIFVSTDETGKAKSAYLSATAWVNRDGKSQYGDTHHISQSFSKEFRELHEEYCKNTPILGNAQPVGSNNASSSVNAPSVGVDSTSEGLPF